MPRKTQPTVSQPVFNPQAFMAQRTQAEIGALAFLILQKDTEIASLRNENMQLRGMLVAKVAKAQPKTEEKSDAQG